MHILELSKIAQRHWSTEVWKTNSVIILQRIQVGGGVSVGGIVSVVVPACCRRCFTLHHPDWKHIQYRSVQIVEGFFWNVTHLHMNGWEHTHTSPSDLMLVSLGDLLSCQAAEAVVSTTPGEAWQLLKHSVCVCGGFSSRIFSVQFVLFLQSRFCGSCTKPHQIKILALFLNEIESWVAWPEDLGELESVFIHFNSASSQSLLTTCFQISFWRL